MTKNLYIFIFSKMGDVEKEISLDRNRIDRTDRQTDRPKDRPRKAARSLQLIFLS